MIPKTNTVAVTDTLPGKETQFTIGNPFWVMESLADLYSNKELAVVREISTNARDSQVEAGNGDKPIEVTLPTIMNPYFVVKDHGVGMSESELETIYTKFGVSTKRDSNDYNGMLGFGSKAPIAYTSAFTVTAVKDGIKTHAVINKKPDAIVLKVVMTAKTDEPNGVEIRVPVHNHEAFSRIAMDFYRFWFPGTVLVDGVEPEQAVGSLLADDVLIGDDDNGWAKGSLYYSVNPGTSYVVMGNVGYRIANPAALFRNSKMGDLSFVAFVPNGSVEFVPSREDLKYTDLTKRTLQQVISNFENKILVESKTEIEKAKDSVEAWKTWNQWGQRLGFVLFKGLGYKGETFDQEIAVDARRYEIIERTDYYGSRRYSTYSINSWPIERMDNTIIVHNFTPTLNTNHKAKMRQYREQVDFKFKYVLFVEKEVKSPWIEDKRIVTWEQVKAAIPRRVYGGPGSVGPIRIKGTFDYFTKSAFVSEKPLPSGTVMYVTAAERKEYDICHILTLLDSDANVVVLAKNRIDKFKRDNPQTQNFIEYANSQLILDGESLLSEKAKKAFRIGANTKAWVKYLELDRIDDPRFQEVAELSDPTKYTAEYEKHSALASLLKRRWDFKKHNISRSDESLMKEYPLLEECHCYRIPEDLYFYINAKYASTNGKKKK